MGNIQFINFRIVDISDEGIDKAVVVDQAFLTSIQVMEGSHTVVVTYTLFQALQDFCRFF
jgi:hypothetical protein